MSGKLKLHIRERRRMVSKGVLNLRRKINGYDDDICRVFKPSTSLLNQVIGSFSLHVKVLFC